MIEIRTDEDAKPITPDGPHDYEKTRAIADGLHEAFRLLNYATMNRGGLTYPSDIYSVLGSLSAALNLFPQALDQMGQWLAAETADGYVRENANYGGHGGDAEAAVADVRTLLLAAAQNATTLADRLGKAQSAAAGLESTRRDED